jgi:hypothetical protein
MPWKTYQPTPKYPLTIRETIMKIFFAVKDGKHLPILAEI